MALATFLIHFHSYFMQNRRLFWSVDPLRQSLADRSMLLYFISVVVMASSIALLVINIGMADTQRMLITIVGAGLFLLGAYGMWIWARRKLRGSSDAV